MLYIYTETFMLWPRLKNFLKLVLGRSFGGPKAVAESLFLGLTELKQAFCWNSTLTEPKATVLVLSGVGTLKWAIKQKKRGKIKSLIAGPNIVLTPYEHNNLIMSEYIDKYIVPATWSVDWWSSFDKTWAKKLAVWPAGVKDSGELVNKSGGFDIFFKSGDFNIVQEAYSLGKKYNLNPSIIFYGKFKHKDYLQLLKDTKIMVYISESESQGLALHEAWMAGVPTLVWNGGGLKLGKYSFKTPNISAPYMSEECGWFFSDQKDLEDKLPKFLEAYKNFKPRQFSLNNFTNKIAAQNLLNILKKVNNEI